MTQTPELLNQKTPRTTLLKLLAPTWVKSLLLFLVGLLLVIGLQQPSWGQLSLPGLSETNSLQPPTGVIRQGDIEVAPVWFDGDILFVVTAKTVRDRNNPSDLLPVEMRAELIQSALRRAIGIDVTSNLSQSHPLNIPAPATITAGVAVLNGETIISVRTPQTNRPLKILTVTETDSQFYGTPIPDLAEEWRGTIQTALRSAASERTIAAILQHLLESVHALTLVAGISLLLLLARRWLKHRLEVIQATQAMADKPTEFAHPSDSLGHSPPTHPRKTDQNPINAWLNPSLYKPSFNLHDTRIKLISLFLFLLVWGQVALWLGGAVFIFNLFPWTRFFALQLLGLPIYWLIIWLLSGFLNSAGDIVLGRAGQLWQRYPIRADTDLQRRHLRISTTLKVLVSLKTTVIYIVAISLVVGSLGIPVGSVIAIGGLLAFAISLGAQSLVRDLINGAFIIWEDQFGIGDVVEIGAVSGTVENMNLRITQLRNGEGRLITIPNSAISIVENLTRTWSRVDFAIDVDSQAQAAEALSLLEQIATDFYQDPAWQGKILEPPEVLGIDLISHSGLTIRTWIKTEPGQQWAVGREFRLRVHQALSKTDINIGRPQQQVVWNPHNTSSEIL